MQWRFLDKFRLVRIRAREIRIGAGRALKVDFWPLEQV